MTKVEEAPKILEKVVSIEKVIVVQPKPPMVVSTPPKIEKVLKSERQPL